MTFAWRSLLYVPAHVDRFVESPRIVEADAVILDLQDSVPPTAKDEARRKATAAAGRIAATGQDVLVRINEDDGLARQDMAACVSADVCALVVPQVRSAEDIRMIDHRLSGIEAEKGMALGSTRLLVLIESAEGLVQMAAIAKASPRIVAINLGNEDLATDLGVAPSEDALRTSRQLLVIAAVAAGVTPLGLIASGTDFTDLESYAALAQASRRMGFSGASCIHPNQIAVLNAAFSPTDDELAWAERVRDAAAGVDGQAAFALDGRMVDPPIVARAHALLRRHAAIAARQSGRPITA